MYKRQDPCTLDEGQGGKKAMQLSIEAHIGEHLPSIGLEGAAVVMQPHPSHTSDQAVGDPGGKFALEGGVLALMAPATDEVVPSRSLASSMGISAGSF